MTQWQAKVVPRLGTTDRPGMCLRFAQSFFGAPAQHRSAWHAWQAQKFRHGPEAPLPDVPVLLWFEHRGAYDDGNGPYDGVPVGQKANWGHVAVHVPGDAIYTSPLSGSKAGQERYANIGQMAAQMNLVYVGWSEDINGLRIAELGEEDEMTPEQAQQLKAVYDAIFKTSPTSLGTPAGLLRMAGATYDAQFKETATSRGTPGGTLVNDRIMLEQNERILAQNAQIMAALNIKPEEGSE